MNIKLKDEYTGYFGYNSNESIKVYDITREDVEIQYGTCGRRETYKCLLFNIYDKEIECFRYVESYYFKPLENF